VDEGRSGSSEIELILDEGSLVDVSNSTVVGSFVNHLGIAVDDPVVGPDDNVVVAVVVVHRIALQKPVESSPTRYSRTP
jgi:hypothetical protein